MKNFDWVFFPTTSTDPDDEACQQLQGDLHDVLDHDRYGEVRVSRSGPGVAVLIRVLDDEVTDESIQDIVKTTWSKRHGA